MEKQLGQGLAYKSSADELWRQDKMDVNFSDTLFGLSSGSGGCTEIAELSKPDEVDANHQGNARELLASDLSSCRPVELCVKYITRCDTNKLLGTGNFGNANLGEDRVLSKTFVVKKITFTRNDQTAIDEIRSIFQKEISVRPFLIAFGHIGFAVSHKNRIQAITASRHPNFVSLYGYSLNANHTYQYLVYDLPVNGPLSAFLRDGGNKAVLTADVRLSIICGLARAVHVLHNDGRAGSSFFHRDIQSENIYLTKHYKAQLMDCGLAKFVPTDSSTSTTMLVMNYPPATHVYMDPKFLENANTNPYSYQASYDVYSMGVVMVELIVGCLIVGQPSKHGTKNSDVFRCCIEEMDGNPIPNRLDELKKRAEILNWSRKSLDLVCDVAICCTKPATTGRMTTKHVLLQLKEAIHNSGHNLLDSEMYNCEECLCFVCGYHKASRTCSKGHKVCPSCIEDNIEFGLSGNCQHVCPLKKCRSSDDYIYGYISCEAYDRYLALRDPQETYRRKVGLYSEVSHVMEAEPSTNVG